MCYARTSRLQIGMRFIHGEPVPEPRIQPRRPCVAHARQRGKKCFVAPPGEPLGGHWAHSRASAGAPRPRYTSRHLLASVLQREVGEVVASPTQNLGAPSALSLQASKHLASTVRALVRPWLAAILALPGPLTPPPKRRDAQRLVGCDLLSAARCSVRAPAARKTGALAPRRLRACTPPVGCPR